MVFVDVRVSGYRSEPSPSWPGPLRERYFNDSLQVTSSMSTTAAPIAINDARPTPQRRLDEMVDRLRAGAPVFARLGLEERIELARAMRAGYARLAERQVHAACAAKGIRLGTPPEGEEWATGPWCVVRQLRLILASLAALAEGTNTPIGPVGRTADGRLSVQVFPTGPIDRLLFARMTVDVHCQPSVDERALHDTRAAFYRGRPHGGRTVLVLGAGNIAAIPAMDLLTMMFNEGKVCLLKMNPVNAYLGPIIEEAFEAAVARGFLAVAYGGAEEGAYLAQHPGIDEVHLTGSDQTYDALVWGPAGLERESRKARNAPLLAKPVTAELGNVSPILVVPGPYSDRELVFQAESIAGSVTYNASFNCNAGKMLVSPGGWDGRRRLLGALETIFAATPPRHAYYPGAAERWRRLVEGRPAMRAFGSATDGRLPWTLLPGLDPADAGEPAFATEPFCSILSEVELGSDDPVEYLERAVDFANDRLWGTLAAMVVVHPASLRDHRVRDAVERAILRLRYGAVAVNSWVGMTFALGSPPWGAHPSSMPADIQSGSGWVHNTSMLEGIEKTVLRHPLTIAPKPGFFPSHRTAHVTNRRLVRLEEELKLRHLPGVIAAAVRA